MEALSKAELAARVRALERAVAREKTASAKLKKALAEALEQQTATGEILSSISGSITDAKPVFDAIVRNLLRLFGTRFAGVVLLREGKLHLAGVEGEQGYASLVRRFPVPVDEQTLVGKVTLAGQVMQFAPMVGNPAVPPVSQQFAREFGFNSQIAAPMMREGKVIGVIATAHRDALPFNDKQVAVLKSFADQAVIAIENARLFNETKEALERQTATAEILKVISSSPTDTEPVFDAIVRNATKLCESQFANVFRYDGELIHYVASHGWPPHLFSEFRDSFPMRPDTSRAAGRAILGGRPVRVEDTRADPDYSHELAQSLVFRRILGVPLMRRGEPVGVITVGWSEPGAVEQRHEDLLKAFADQAVIAIENVRLFKETNEALEQQTAISEVLRVISDSPTDVKPVLDAVALRAARICEASDARIWLVDGGSVRHVAGFGDVPMPIKLGDALPLDHSTVSARAILDRAPVHIEDAAKLSRDEYPITREMQQRSGFRTILAVPLMREQRALGAIMLRRMEVRPFTEKQVFLLKTFADQAAIAIENVRLFNETKEALSRQTATAEILGVISSSPSDVQPVFEAIARNARALCDSLFAIVVRYDGEKLHFAASQEFSATQGEVVKRMFPWTPDRGRAVGRAILSKSVICIEDVLADPEYDHSVARSGGWRRMLAVPMLREQEPLGAIWVGWTDQGPIPKVLQELLKTFADQAVIAIENVRLFNETKEALEQQKATADVLSVIAGSPTDTQPVFDAIAESCVRLFGGKNVAVALARGDKVELAAFATTGGAQAREKYEKLFPLPLNEESVTGRAILGGKVVYVPDVEADAALGERAKALARGMGYRNVLCAPMIREGKGIGSINVHRDASEAQPYTDKQIALLKAFADQAVIAIENVRLFNETKEALEQQTATAEILRVISSTPTDTQPVFDAIVQSALRIFNGDGVGILLVDGDRLLLGSAGGAIDRESARKKFPLPLNRESVSGEAILGRSVVNIGDIQAREIPELAKDLGRELDYRAIASAPMLREGIAIGAIAVSRKLPGAFTEKEIALLKTFADQAVIAIENARLFNETKEALEQQTATAEILKVISSSPTDMQPVFDAIARNGVRLCNARFGIVFLFDGELISLAAHHDMTEQELQGLGRIWPMPPNSESLIGRTVLERRVIHVYDYQVEFAKYAALLPTIRSIVSVPMLRGGTPIGTLAIFRRELAPFTEQQIELLQTFADQAVIAIENVRLFKELAAQTAALAKSVEQLTALGAVGQAISSTLDLETVLTTIVSRALLLTKLDGGAISEYDEQTEQLQLRAAENLDEEVVEVLRRTPIRKGEGAIGRTAATREPTQIPDTTDESYQSRVREPLVRAGHRALLAVPLVREDHLIGALVVTRKTPGSFGAEVIELLQTFAAQSALAIQNARLFREIGEKSRQLEVASRHKSDFLASMSHELRTPLNAILGFNEMILGGIYGEVPADMREPLADIQTSGKHLLRLINNVLDLAKIEAGRMELALAEYSASDLVETVRSTLRPLAAEKGLEFVTAVAEDLPLAYGDPGRVTQCLMNLAGNALKFTRQGRVEIAVELRDRLLRYRVADTGMGIPPDKIASLFSEFRQTDATIASEYGGTGLGLSITKKFVEMQGGRIWVESEQGKGSAFLFEIPVRVREGATA